MPFFVDSLVFIHWTCSKVARDAAELYRSTSQNGYRDGPGTLWQPSLANDSLDSRVLPNRVQLRVSCPNSFGRGSASLRVFRVARGQNYQIP